MGLLTVSENRRVYFEDHAGHGLPVLLIHGWGMSCRVWDSTLAALLAAGHRVVTFDQRGCGNSDKDFGEVSIEASGADAIAVLRHLGIRRAAVNGWSLGGAVAVERARLLGPDCAGVILTGGATPATYKPRTFRTATRRVVPAKRSRCCSSTARTSSTG